MENLRSAHWSAVVRQTNTNKQLQKPQAECANSWGKPSVCCSGQQEKQQSKEGACGQGK
jgi:hypothetical protein